MATDRFTTFSSTDGKQRLPAGFCLSRIAAVWNHLRSGSDRPPICGEPAVLPVDLVLTALRYADRRETEPADLQDVRCTLQAHPTSGDHYAFVVETAAATSAWARWNRGGQAIVLVLPNCLAIDPHRHETCSEYELHPGGHTWQVDDPLNPVQPAR